MNKKLLTICCARGRPELLKVMIDSFKLTSSFSDLVIGLDLDDPCLPKYREMFPDLNLQVFNRKTTVQIINKLMVKYPDYDYYSVSNDDMVYLTKDWDTKMCVKGHMNSPQEPNMIKKHGKAAVGFPCLMVVDSRLPKAIGWLMYPKLEHCCGDNFWYWIADRLKILKYHSDVIIRHDHYLLVGKEKDDTYKRSNNMDRMKRDWKTHINWLKYEINDDLDKIRRVICQE